MRKQRCRTPVHLVDHVDPGLVVGVGSEDAAALTYRSIGARSGVIYARKSTNISGGRRTPIDAACLGFDERLQTVVALGVGS